MNITDINAKLQDELASELYNYNFLKSWIPEPLMGNKYEIYRADAPFYCLGSKRFMLNSFSSDTSFRISMIEMINESQNNYTICAKDINGNLFNALASFAIDNIKTANGGNASKQQLVDDLQEVAYHIGILAYVTINVNQYYMGDFNTVFMKTWYSYYTNDLLG